MSNENTPEQKQAQNNAKASNPVAASSARPSSSSSAPSSSVKKSSSKRKGNKSAIGGTALPGAKSTQTKPVSTSSDPNQQQIESYNRTMRRRMEHIGAGPYSQDDRAQTLQEKRQKKLDRRKQRLDEKRAELRKSLPAAGKISLGRRNLYFLIAAIILVILIIGVFAILRVTHTLGF
jgi:hypothetical protein